MTLRHSAAKGWLAAGLPMIYVQRQLGHSTISTTINLYGHLEESFLRNAAVRPEAAIWGPPPRLVPRPVPRATLLADLCLAAWLQMPQIPGLPCDADERTRTSTGFLPHGPEPCASTNSATSARRQPR